MLRGVEANLVATGRTLVFDGFLKVLGVQATDEQTLPSLGEGSAALR